MTTFVLDLNDSELRIARVGPDNIEVVAQSTGFALISERLILLGEAALQQFRLQPRQASNQFWNRLSTDPLPVRGPDTANFADLVFRHLSELVAVAGIGKTDELYIAVPGTTTPEQLGLLVGIAAETGVSATGLVDSAVAASSLYPATTPLRYIDVFLHRLVLTELSIENGVTRQRVQDFAELGLGSLTDAWVNVIADRFVRDTRFDPLGIAATDQQLYNQLRVWLQQATLAQDLSVEFEHHGTMRRAELTSEAMIAKVVPRYRVLEKDAGEATFLLSHRAARLPGLSDHVSGSGINVAVLDPLEIFRGIAAHLQSVRSDPLALRLVTRLPRLAAPHEAPARPAPRPRHSVGAPTHIVFDGDALAIGAGLALDAGAFSELPAQFPRGGIEVVKANDFIQLRLKGDTQATLNGQPARSGALIDKGSVLEIGGAVFRFVRIRSTLSTMPRRTLTIFTMSFLDVMSCGFGAIILIYLVVNHGTEYAAKPIRDDRRAEMRKLDFEVETGQANLSQIQTALTETERRMDEAKLKRLKVLASLLENRNAQAEMDAETLAKRADLEKLRADVASKEEDVKRLEAKAEATEGQSARSFIGEGNRQYLTGLKIGGDHILVAFDTSASMLDDTIVNVLRRRNMDDERKKKAPKWVRTVATVEWLAAQFPLDSQFQIIGFGESAKTMADGTEGHWIDVSNSKDLERAVSAVKATVPAGGTNLDSLATAVAGLSPSPDNIYIVTDGLPTQGSGGAKKATVTGRQRVQLFNDAVKKLPRGVPINVILMPLEGDPVASGEFWRLAQATGGTYLAPSRDWP